MAPFPPFPFLPSNLTSVVHPPRPVPQTSADEVRSAGLQFPVLCKSLAAHGSDAAHEMHIVFNAATLPSLPAPYVAQQFINHDAVLFKVFAIGDTFAVVARPSIRNLVASSVQGIISFHSHDVSKATSTSFLNEVCCFCLWLPGGRRRVVVGVDRAC